MFISLSLVFFPVILFFVGLFLVGKFNALVQIRRRIVTEALQLDFALRQTLDLALKNREEEGEAGQLVEFANQMLMIESMAHRGAANPVSTEGITLLVKAVKLLGSLNHMIKHSYHEEVSKREKSCLTQVHEYNALLRDLPTALIAWAFGFKPICSDGCLKSGGKLTGKEF